MEEQTFKWQPVMLITDKRVECKCGALAIFVILEEDEESDRHYTTWCQSCFQRAQEEIEAC